MTGCTRVDEWIVYRAPIGIYMFNLIGSSPPFIGFSVDLTEILSSVSYEEFEENRMLQAHIYEDSPGQFLSKLVKK